ncbi:hypothetical protein TPA0598_09_02750 [Streptomyces lydicamycinicus]|uniref:Uncharacterized protein n=1 Tax=Streptomyces lydicamycinicus TaxID=1546107 RepID=A0A0P4RGA3_9ACTN|nr:hypothetical protein TPA0598_09_02750 [Streptomyces lydicamycinicus]
MMANMQVNGSGSFTSNEPEPDRAEFVLTSAAVPSGPFGGVVLDRCWLLALRAEPRTAPRRTRCALFTVRHRGACTRLSRGRPPRRAHEGQEALCGSFGAAVIRPYRVALPTDGSEQ